MDKPMNPNDRNRNRYLQACHAMQTGVSVKMNYDPTDTTPKHLRVGVNVAIRDLSSLAHLLMKKRIITEEEYLLAIADGMEEEKIQYEDVISDLTGRDIKLA